MKFNNIILALFMLMGTAAYAQNVLITVTDDGQPMAYHNITISYGDYVLGTGQTNSNGFVSIYAPNLRSKSIDVAGKYQNGGTKKEWSIKGKLTLDYNNSVHIRLEEITKEIEATRRDMDARMQKMKDKIGEGFGNHSSTFDEGFGERSSIFDKDDDDDFDNDDDGFDDDFFDETRNTLEKGQQLLDATEDLFEEMEGGSSSRSFNTKMKQLKNARFSSDKEKIALDIVRSNSLSTRQIIQVMDELTGSFDKEKIAKKAYKKCSDKRNYEKVIQELNSTFSQDDVRKATIGR